MSSDPIEIKRAIARAELQKNLTSAQTVIDKMMAQLQREGVAPAAIQECLSSCGAELEHDVRRMEKDLQPDSGTSQDKAIKVTHPLQEILLMNEIKAEPLFYRRIKADNGRRYDEYSVLRETATGDRLETTVWFDITESYDKFVKLTKRTAQTKQEAMGSAVCFSCGSVKPLDEMHRCKGCKMARYCNRQCQRRHWKGEHKTICKGVQAEQAKLEARIAHMEIQEAQRAQIFQADRKKRAKELKKHSDGTDCQEAIEKSLDKEAAMLAQWSKEQLPPIIGPMPSTPALVTSPVVVDGPMTVKFESTIQIPVPTHIAQHIKPGDIITATPTRREE